MHMVDQHALMMLSHDAPAGFMPRCSRLYRRPGPSLRTSAFRNGRRRIRQLGSLHCLVSRIGPGQFCCGGCRSHLPSGAGCEPCVPRFLASLIGIQLGRPTEANAALHRCVPRAGALVDQCPLPLDDSGKERQHQPPGQAGGVGPGLPQAGRPPMARSCSAQVSRSRRWAMRMEAEVPELIW